MPVSIGRPFIQRERCMINNSFIDNGIGSLLVFPPSARKINGRKEKRQKRRHYRESERERERRGGGETEFRRKMKLLDTYLNIKNVVMSATES